VIQTQLNLRRLTITFTAFAVLALAACGGDDDDAPAETTPASGEVSAAPTTSVAPATAYPTPPSIPAATCVTGEAIYRHPENRFAFCYPDDMTLTTSDFNGQIAVTVAYPEQDNRVAATFVFELERVQPNDNPCLTSPFLIKNERVEDYTVSGVTTPACFQDHFRQDLTDELVYKGMQVEAPAAFGYVSIGVAGFGPDFDLTEAAAKRLLDSAAIPQGE